jgi:hypothetical protein
VARIYNRARFLEDVVVCRSTFVVIALFVVLAACGGGNRPDADGAPALPLLAAGSAKLDPSTDAFPTTGLDLARLDVGDADIRATYDFTTPADEPLTFDILSRSDGNAGAVRVSVAHVADGGGAPVGDAASLATAGLVASGPGRSSRGPWLDTHGDGFGRITVRGSITRDQVLAVETDTGSGPCTALVRLRIGAPSAINLAAAPAGDYPGILDETTLYSSNSWMFGLPTAAVSGDRTSVVFYEGDLGDPDAWGRYEMRIQHDTATGAVTGGGSEETSPDRGNWRDHEIAALFNVLALVHGGDGVVSLKLSFDRGATFAQTEVFDQGANAWRPRLVQVAIALDYTLAVLFWRSNVDGSTDLVLVEGRPSAYDGTGSPTAFAFDPVQVVHHDAFDVTPMLMSAVWSESGDLVIGYGFTRFTTMPDRTWESVTQNRCAVRPWGGEFLDVLVEEDRMVGKDPSVAVTGGGATLRVFYAYENRDGVALRVSEDGGATFLGPIAVDAPGAHMPTVFARDSDAGTTVDLLYLAYGDEGMEIHLRHWPVFSLQAPGETYRLTRALMEDGGTLPPDRPVPGAPDGVLPPTYGFRITQVAWFGYDAVLDGDEIVVIYDEETYDAIICLGGPEVAFGAGVPLGPVAGDAFVPVDPPPLAPGMTEPVDAPDPDEMHQLKLLRLR